MKRRSVRRLLMALGASIFSSSATFFASRGRSSELLGLVVGLVLGLWIGWFLFFDEGPQP